jgi:predicted nucleic acid-binding protein
VTRYLLDTNIISNVTKPTPVGGAVAWMGLKILNPQRAD